MFAPCPPPPDPPGVVVVVIDDVGHDLLADACTPAIDALAADGVTFENYWSAPLCSPARSMLLTGRYGLRTGIGHIVNASGLNHGLALEELTLPEVLVEHDSAALGKWHLARELDDSTLHPNHQGFGYFSGVMANIGMGPWSGGWNPFLDPCAVAPNSYYDWVRVRQGVETCQSEYVTTATIDDAVSALGRVETPALIYVATTAVHGPLDEPPPELLSCDDGEHLAVDTLEALDTELGRFLALLPRDVWVILVSDNGTAEAVYGDPKAKDTIYEGGLRVPCIVRGPGVPRGVQTDALASAVDVFATIVDLAGQERVANTDGVSLLPHLLDRQAPTRSWLYSEAFEPNGDPALADSWDRAVRTGTHKLIQRHERGVLDSEEMYDLVADPDEDCPLPLSGATYDELAALMESVR